MVSGPAHELRMLVVDDQPAIYECICAAFNADLNYEDDPAELDLPTEEKDMQDYIKAELPM